MTRTIPRKRRSTPTCPAASLSIQGQEFIVFGVTKPIASAVTDNPNPYWYSISNRTSLIAYTIKNSSGGTVLTSSHDVNLSRYFTPGSTTRYNSLFEFGSEFTAPADSRYLPGQPYRHGYAREIPSRELHLVLRDGPSPAPDSPWRGSFRCSEFREKEFRCGNLFRSPRPGP